MENFFISCSKSIKFTTNNYLYNGEWIDGNTLCDEKTAFPIPFNVTHFINMKYDYALLSDDNVLYRLNKCRMKLESVGSFDDGIVTIGYNDENIVVVTVDEMFLFNAYFELLRTKAHEIGFQTNAWTPRNGENSTMKDGKEVQIESGKLANPKEHCEFVWADDLFCLFTHSGFFMFNLNFELVGSSSLKITSAAFISKYNKFACVLDGAIKFIEPNGLEHGEPLEVNCDAVKLLKVDDAELLLAVHKNRVEAYYMRNFYWYKKLELEGEFFGCEMNRIIFKNQRSVSMHFVCKELTTDFVIDGSELKYTNLSVASIPPPYFYKSLVFESHVLAYARTECLLYVLTKSSLYKYRIENDCFYKEGVVECGLEGIVNEMVVFDGLLLARCGNHIYRLTNDEFRNVCVFNVSNVIKMRSFSGKLCLLFSNGCFGWMPLNAACFNSNKCEVGSNLNEDDSKLRMLKRFEFNENRSFRLEVFGDVSSEADMKESDSSQKKAPKIYLLTGNLLQIFDGQVDEPQDIAVSLHNCHINQYKNLEGVNISIIENVYSFILFKKYLIYVVKDKLVIADNGVVCSEIYADPGMSLLAVVNNRIISLTRFGSLETMTNKVFSRALVTESLQKRQYREAANICDENHIDYDIFYNDGKCSVDIIDELEDNQVFSLVSTLRVDSTVIHENDTLQRLNSTFNIDQVFNKAREPCNTRYITNDAINHLFDTPYHSSLFHIDPLPAPKVDEDFIVTAEPVESLNKILKRLRNGKHNNTIIRLFIMIGRVDWCFYLPDTKRVARTLVGLISSSDILKASIVTLSLEKITAAYRACQCDVLPFTAFYQSSRNLPFSLYDYVENRELALYHLISQVVNAMASNHGILATDYGKGISTGSTVSFYDLEQRERDRIAEYVEKYDLMDQLVMYQQHKIFPINFYTYVASHYPPEKAFDLLILGNDRDAALDLAYKNVLWKQALPEFTGKEVALRFVELLEEEGRCLEIGTIYDVFVGDYRRAIRYYMRGGSYGNAMSVWKKVFMLEETSLEEPTPDIKSVLPIDEDPIRDEVFRTAKVALKNEMLALSQLEQSLKKYTNRINQVRERLSSDVELSQTSYSYSSSAKSVKNALIKDRPGGVYENEYVLNKIRDNVVEIVALYRRITDLVEILDMCDANGSCKYTAACTEAFGELRQGLRRKVETLWEYKRHDYDPNRPVIEKPVLPLFFE